MIDSAVLELPPKGLLKPKNRLKEGAGIINGLA